MRVISYDFDVIISNIITQIEGSQFSSDDAKVLFAYDVVDMIAIPSRAAILSIFVGPDCAQKNKLVLWYIRNSYLSSACSISGIIVRIDCCALFRCAVINYTVVRLKFI